MPRSRWRAAAELAAIVTATASGLFVASAWSVQFGGRPDPPAVDFANFYALGFAVSTADARQALVSDEAWRHLIRALTPAGNDYPRVYGPQTAFVFAPLARLPFPVAYLMWNLVSLVAFSLCVRWFVVRHAAVLCPRHFWVVAGVMAFQPLVHLLMLGHAGVIAVAGLAIATAGFSNRSRLVAGAGLGLLSYKPTLFIPVCAIVLFGGHAGAAVVAGSVAALLLIATVPLLGFEPIEAYARALIGLGQSPDAVAKPAIMGSLRTLWAQLLPAAVATWTYAITAIVVVLVAAWAWRRSHTVLHGIGIAAVATSLATPHLYLYDLVIVAPALIASAAWVAERRVSWGLLAVAAALAYVAAAVSLHVEGTPVSLPALANTFWYGAMVFAWTRPLPPPSVAGGQQLDGRRFNS